MPTKQRAPIERAGQARVSAQREAQPQHDALQDPADPAKNIGAAPLEKIRHNLNPCPELLGGTQTRGGVDHDLVADLFGSLCVPGSRSDLSSNPSLAGVNVG